MDAAAPRPPASSSVYPAPVPPLLAALYVPWRWLVFVPFVGLLTVLVTPPLLLLALLSENAAYNVCRGWAHAVRLANFTRLRVRGREHIRPGTGYVVMTNHQSAFDFTLIAALPGQLRWVMMSEVRRIPVFAQAAQAGGAVWVDRSDRGASIASLDAMRPKLARGVSLQIFPEGTRSKDGDVGPLKKGGFMLPLSLGVPILPVTIHGSGAVWPANTWRILPGTIEYTVHPPIDVREYGLERREELMAAVRTALRSGLPRA